MIEANQGRHAVVLSGGGAYAAYEIGIMKALFAGVSPATAPTPVDPDIFTGTSAGAFNASFLVSQTGADSRGAVQNLEQVWLTRLAGDAQGCSNGVARYRLDPFTLLNPACSLRDPALILRQIGEDLVFLVADGAQRLTHFFGTTGGIQGRLASLIDLSAFVVENLNRVIPETIAFQNIVSSPKALRIAITNWTTGKLEICSNDSAASKVTPAHVEASAAIPGFFPPVHIGGSIYVDGGVLMNTPLKPAIDADAGTLHVIYLDPHLAKHPVPQYSGTLDVMNRIMTIANAAAANQDIENAARINRGLELLGSAGPFLTDPHQQDVVRFLGQAGRSSSASEPLTQKYRQVTIHRYHPDDALGGMIGLLAFDRPNIERLIQRGYDDALHHDCNAEGCIAPNGLSEWPSLGTPAQQPA